MKRKPILRLLAFDHSRTLACWCAVRAGKSPTLRVRRIAHEIEQSHQPLPTVLEAGLAQLLALFVSMRQVLIAWRPVSRGVRGHYGVKRSRQLLDLLKVTWHANLPPRVYYFQRLFRHPPPSAYLEVIDHRELQLLLRDIHAGVDTTVLEDKAVFHAFCAEQGLPTPPIIAMYADGVCEKSASSSDEWKSDLFSKPAISYSSHGIACWRYDPVTNTHREGASVLDRPALQARFTALSKGGRLIVQPRVRNSAELAPISGHALANCRVVTARRPDGTVTILLAALRMGRGEAITSDEPTQSFCAAVNLQTGVLGLAESKQAERGSFTHHPESHAPITGVTLSRWPEMREMVLRAHHCLHEIIFAGWDVIDTEAGPMLLEGNVVWGGNLAQMAGNPPLGATGFSELFLHHHLQRKKIARPETKTVVTEHSFQPE